MVIQYDWIENDDFRHGKDLHVKQLVWFLSMLKCWSSQAIQPSWAVPSPWNFYLVRLRSRIYIWFSLRQLATNGGQFGGHCWAQVAFKNLSTGKWYDNGRQEPGSDRDPTAPSAASRWRSATSQADWTWRWRPKGGGCSQGGWGSSDSCWSMMGVNDAWWCWLMMVDKVNSCLMMVGTGWWMMLPMS